MAFRNYILVLCFLLCNYTVLSQKLPLVKVLASLSKPDSLPPLNRLVPRFDHLLVKSVSEQFRNSFFDSALHIKKLLSGAVTNIARNPFVFHNGELTYSGLTDSSYFRNGKQYYFGNFEVNSNWSIAAIPVTIYLQNQYWSDISNENPVVFSVRFDRDNYLTQLKNKLKGKINSDYLLQKITDPLLAIRQQAEKLFKDELKSLNNRFNQLLKDRIEKLGGLTNLSQKDMSALQQQLLGNEYIQKALEKENLLAQLHQRKLIGEPVNDTAYNELGNSVQEMKGVQEMLAVIERHKQKWESSGLVKKMKEWDLLKKDKLLELINNPSTIIKQARQHLNLSGMQKLFLNITKMDIGQNPVSLSPMSFSHFLNKGISMEFLQGNRPFMFIAGRQKDITSLLDMPFAGNLFSNNGTNKAVRIGIGSTKTSVSNITVSSFGQSLFNFTVPSNVNLYRRVLVTTFSNQVRMGEKGIVSVDLSRSATHYQQEAAATDSTLRDRSSLSKILSANNLLDNTAVSIVYSDELGAEGLSYQFSFNKVSNGYVNPGNAFLSNGSTELGLNLRKMFLKNKIQVTLRGKGRQYSYDVNGNRKWKNIFAMLDARWKMKKGQYLSVRYQPTRMIRIEQSSKQVVSINDRLSVDANLYKRWHRITYRNQVTLSYQKSSYDFNRSSLSTSSFMVNSFQNISLGKNLLFTNISYNKAANSSGFIYLNSSFIAETGFTYQLFNKLSASSGLTYNSIAGWYKQLGIRQSLSGQLGEKFSMNIYIDAGKTLSLLQPLWNEPVRADISIRYILGNNN